MNILKTAIFCTICLLNITHSNAKSNELKEMYTELMKGFISISENEQYSAIIMQCNTFTSKKFEKGVIEVNNLEMNKTYSFEITSVHEAINQLIWTRDNMLIITARSTSMHRYICVYNPVNNLVVFEEFTLGNRISISPDQKKIAFIKSLPRNISESFYSNILRISFDISKLQPSSIYPVESNLKHIFYPLLEWNNNSDRISLIEKVNDSHQLLVISKHDEDLIITKKEVSIDKRENPFDMYWIDDNTIDIKIESLSELDNSMKREVKSLMISPFIHE